MTAYRVNKPRRPGTEAAAVTAAIEELGGRDRAADVVGKSASFLAKASDPDLCEGDRPVHLTYRDARALSRAGALALAHDLALEAGGLFMPGVRAPRDRVSRMTGTLLRQVAEAAEAALDAADDGDVDPREAERVLTEIREAMSALADMQAYFVDIARPAKGGA